jgi:hypothetical protein
MKTLILSTVLSLSVMGCTPAAGALSQLKQAFIPASIDPLGMNESYQRNFSKLNLSGSIDESAIPWSDSEWPSLDAGIANRWLAASSADEATSQFDYELNSYEQLSRMTPEEIRLLSPAEKFDIYNGRYDYPTVKAEWIRNQNADQSDSLIHGWAAASLNFEEPSIVKVMSEDGIELVFTSSDVKALLSYYQGQVAFSRTMLLGEKCRVEFDRYAEKACKETNPGAFHMVLANELGRQNQGFVMDLKFDGATLNFPVHSYRSTILQDNLMPLPTSAIGTSREIEVQTVVVYSNPSEANIDATNGSELHRDLSVVYQYRLQLDAKGLILGGAWISSERPEFMWRQDSPVFEKDFAKLGILYEASIAK